MQWEQFRYLMITVLYLECLISLRYVGTRTLFTTFGVTANDELEVTIEHKTQTQKTLITTNYPCVVKEESFSETKVAKVTTYTAILTSPPPAVDNVTDWYLFTDGTIGNDPTAGTREEGDWSAVLVDDYNDAETVAQNEFNKTHILTSSSSRCRRRTHVSTFTILSE
jgi:hypothetical protein